MQDKKVVVGKTKREDGWKEEERWREEKRILFRRETRWQGFFNNDRPTPLIGSHALSSFLLSFSFSFPSAVVRVWIALSPASRFPISRFPDQAIFTWGHLVLVANYKSWLRASLAFYWLVEALLRHGGAVDDASQICMSCDSSLSERQGRTGRNAYVSRVVGE